MTITVTVRHPVAMHSHHATEHDMRDSRAVWSDDNSRGLALGAAGDWSDAADAFAVAADAISARQGTNASMGSGSHDALALVLGNLAGASFRAGRSEDAIRHAQRACALRVALVGEDAVAVARARSDLAVMLCAVGRAEEAYALLERAIVGIEHHAGDEDSRLAPVLENAARVAIAMARPANAEPHLLRLHALLAAHDLPTTSADVLLAQVAASRHTGTDLPPAEDEDDGFTLVDADANDADADDADMDAEDQPLRDAVALTDILLRTTPRGVPAIAFNDERAPIELLDSELRMESGQGGTHGTRDALEAMRARADSATAEAMPEDLEVAATFARELERDLHATLPAPKLGFTVQYGFDGYEDARRALDESASRETESLAAAAFVPSPTRSYEPVDESAAMPTAHDAANVSANASESATLAFVGAVPHVRDDADAGRSDGAGEPDESTDAADDADSTRRRPFGTALRAGRATAPQSSHGVLIAAAITLAAGATAAWAYLRAAG